VSGLLVPPGDISSLVEALRELLGDPQRQRTMGAIGRDMVAARFSRERHVASLLESYHQARYFWLTAASH
jgi:glycosyltransferase involved in cell wall biosynthesis